MTQLLFISIYVVVIVLCHYADKYNSKKELYTSIIILTIAAGLRDSNVGIDTEGYIWNILSDFPYPWKFKEEGFRFISRFLMDLLGGNVTLVLLSYALITNLLIILRIWEFRDRASFSFMMLLYLCLHYINTFNIMRQYISIALVFYATGFLEKRKILLFVISLAVAASIHNSALLGAIFPFVFYWKEYKIKYRKILIIPLSISLLLIGYYIYMYSKSDIIHYLSTNIDNLNYVYAYHVTIFVLSLALQYKGIDINIVTKYRSNINKNKLEPISACYVIFSIIGVITSSLGMFFPFMTRIGLIYAIFEIVFWGRICKCGYSRGSLLLLLIVYVSYYFGSELVMNGSGIFPYSIHWPF